jgi:hypothetical protein
MDKMKSTISYLPYLAYLAPLGGERESEQARVELLLLAGSRYAGPHCAAAAAAAAAA